MEGKIIRDWLFIIAIFAVGIILLIYLKGNANQCFKAPMQYGIKQIEKANNNYPVQCSCVVKKILPVSFEANSTNIYFEPAPEQQQIGVYNEPNYSDFKFG